MPFRKKKKKRMLNLLNENINIKLTISFYSILMALHKNEMNN